jgi:endonuclease-3
MTGVDTKSIHAVMAILKDEYGRLKTPYVTIVSEKTRDPVKVLVSCVLSLRTKDETTASASKRLFKVAPDAKSLSKLTTKKLEKLIYPVGFYRTKAITLKEIAKRLVNEFDSRVPDTIDGLLEFKGVGRKTANLVMTLGHGLPGICVDTHVHRITNRWGYVKTKTPEETEFALRKKLPREYWIPINDYLVAYGQNICRPVSPKCSECRLYGLCARRGVDKSR